MTQHDGGHVQVQREAQTNVLIEYNWSHDTPKFAYRFDGDGNNIGE